MIVFINGAFGIGKTTVARALVKRCRKAVLYNPEFAGIGLQRASRLFGRPVDDFQDLPSWRRATVVGIRLSRLLAPVVVVPMAFSNADYLGEIQTAVRRFDASCRHFCLVAPVPIVEERLRKRRVTARDAAWQHRRAVECCIAHRDAAFATHVGTEGRTVEQVVSEIAELLPA